MVVMAEILAMISDTLTPESKQLFLLLVNSWGGGLQGGIL